MSCPYCGSEYIANKKRRTSLGCRIYYYNSCGRQYPTDVVLLAVLWRLRYKLGFRDVAELLLERGFEPSYETIRVWEFRFPPLVSENLRARRRVGLVSPGIWTRRT